MLSPFKVVSGREVTLLLPFPNEEKGCPSGGEEAPVKDLRRGVSSKLGVTAQEVGGTEAMAPSRLKLVLVQPTEDVDS